MHTRLTLWTHVGVLISVLTLAASCGGGSSAAATPGTEPYTVSGLQILTHGGAGLDGAGGEGGDFDFQAYTGGNIEIRRVGVVDTTFTVPAANPALGTNPRTITADVILTPDGSNEVLGDDGVNPATGVHVLPGITLTLRGNRNSDGTPVTMEWATLTVDTAILLEGALTGYADETTLGDGLSLNALRVDLRADNLIIRPTGSVKLRGKDAATGANGGNGGEFNAYVDQTIINEAPVVTRGGDGDDGGDGGDVYWDSSGNGAIYNTGDVDLSGGRGSNGLGGDGGYYDTHSEYGPQFHSGDVTARGGDGTLGGGDGDGIYFDICDVGLFVNSGDLDASGGHATVQGDGGDADDIELYYYTGPVRMTGTYLARGGDGAGSGNGGDGGTFEIDGHEDEIEDTDIAYGFQIGASIDLRGGSGRDGGDGGDVDLYVDFDESHNPDAAHAQSVLLVGYDLIDASGGSGTADGGAGGYVDLQMEYGNNYDIEYIGSVINEADMVTRGGDGTNGAGGDGGYVEMTTYDDATFHFDRRVANSGALDTCGGSGATTGGDAGDVYFYEYNRIENTGAILASGGDGGTGPGGQGADIEIIGDNIVVVRADITADGGNSVSGVGGVADEIYVYGQDTTCVGAMVCCGGSSTSAAGGDSGVVEVGSTRGPSTLGGSCNVAPGLGTPDGATGEVWLDGVNCDLTNGFVTIP